MTDTGDNEGVYLNFKTRLKTTNEIFDYTDKNTKNVNTFIIGKTDLYMNANNIIYNQKNKTNNKDELFLIIHKINNNFYIDNTVYQKNKPNFENLRKINKYLWYVINSDSKVKKNQNEDFYLEEGDIIKLGK